MPTDLMIKGVARGMTPTTDTNSGPDHDRVRQLDRDGWDCVIHS
jgi:hypothetical protein